MHYTLGRLFIFAFLMYRYGVLSLTSSFNFGIV